MYFRGHNAAVLCVQFDEKKIVSGSYDKTIKVCVTNLCFTLKFPKSPEPESNMVTWILEKLYIYIYICKKLFFYSSVS